MKNGLIERSYELAASGAFRTVTQLKRRLNREGYSAMESALGGLATHRSLKALCQSNRKDETVQIDV